MFVYLPGSNMLSTLALSFSMAPKKTFSSSISCSNLQCCSSWCFITTAHHIIHQLTKFTTSEFLLANSCKVMSSLCSDSMLFQDWTTFWTMPSTSLSSDNVSRRLKLHFYNCLVDFFVTLFHSHFHLFFTILKLGWLNSGALYNCIALLHVTLGSSTVQKCLFQSNFLLKYPSALWNCK